MFSILRIRWSSSLSSLWGWGRGGDEDGKGTEEDVEDNDGDDEGMEGRGEEMRGG